MVEQDRSKDETLPAPLLGLGAIPDQNMSPGNERYTCIERIGSGGMGEVWRARDKKLNRDVAIKVMHERYARDPEFLVRFEEEAKRLAALKHPNIVAIYDVGVFPNGQCFIVMPLLSGRSLAAVIDDLRNGVITMPLSARLHIIEQVASALGAMHAIGVLHRDVKPANILLDAEGKVTLVDCGLACSTASSDSEDGAGTWRYMSPEQFLRKPLDTRSDCWALGVTIVEVLCDGLHLITGDTRREIAEYVITKKTAIALPVHPVWTMLSRVVRGTILRLLEKDLNKRLADVNVVRDVCILDSTFGAIHTWRAMRRTIRRTEARLCHLARQIQLPTVRTERLQLMDAFEQMGEEELLLREDVEDACVIALDKRLTNEGKMHVVLGFYYPIIREARWRGDIRTIQHFTKALIRVLGEHEAMRILHREERFTITSDPPGARVVLEEVYDDGERHAKRNPRELGVTPCEVTVTTGKEWCLTLTSSDSRYPRQVIVPCVGCGVRRTKRDLAIPLFTEKELGGPSVVYIPPIYAIIGGDPKAISSRPQEVVRTQAFCIDKYPVTRQQFYEFLLACTDADRAKWWPASWPKDTVPEPHNAPVTDVFPIAVLAYFDWRSSIAETLVVPPSETEIEVAMRGGDARWFPAGNHFNAKIIPNILMGPLPPQSVESFTLDGRSIFGVCGCIQVGAMCRFVDGDIAPEAKRVAIRPGMHRASTKQMARCATRLAFDLHRASPTWGAWGVRYPKREE